MSAEEKGYEPNEPESHLPRVSEETIEALASDMLSNGVGEIVEGILKRLKNDQPVLYREILRLAEDAKETDGEDAYSLTMHATTLVYELLARQSSADKMDKEFKEK